MSRRRLSLGLTSLLVVVLVAGAAWWGGRSTLQAPGNPLGLPPIPTYKVAPGRVGQVQNVFVNASWALTDVARNGLQGVVTSVEHKGGEAKPGQVLYRVNLQPVVVAKGEVPAFRDITMGTVGPDVVQLQELLGDLGFYGGRANGTFDGPVADAVKRWQRRLKSDESGSVKLGQVLFLSKLPDRLVVGPDVKVGKQLQGAEVAAQQVAGGPTFIVPLLAEQQRLAVAGAQVTARPQGSDITWTGTVATADPGANGGFELKIVGAEGKAMCGEQCEKVPVGPTTVLAGQIVLVAPRDGPVIPVAAVMTSPDGATYVILPDGAERPITILASADGLAVVEGLSVGEVVRVGRQGTR